MNKKGLMRIIITPTGGDSPYITLLATSLEAEALDAYVWHWHSYFPLWLAVRQHGLPDLIHLQWHHVFFVSKAKSSHRLKSIWSTFRFFLQFFSLRLAGVRFVWTVHNVVNHEQVDTGWEILCCRLLARIVNGIIVHCPTAVSSVATAYRIAPERLIVVPLGNVRETLRYVPSVSKLQARQSLGLHTSKRIILFFGAVRAYKGLDRLIEDFAKLDSDQVQLILTGKPKTDHLAQSLKGQASNDPRVITRFEFLPEDTLIRYIAACDLVVLPYSDALTSSAHNLAAALGKCAIVPRLGCFNDFPADAAIVYDSENPEGLRLALERAVAMKPDVLELMGVRARGYVEQVPWAVVAEKTRSVYQHALMTHPRATSQRTKAR